MNPLARATRGRIRIGTIKGTLVLAVAGILFFGTSVTTTTTSSSSSTTTTTSSSTIFIPIPPPISIGVQKTVDIRGAALYLDKQDQLLKEEEELMLLIKLFLKCQD